MLVQSSISFVIGCFAKHDFYFFNYQQLSLKLTANWTSGSTHHPCKEITLGQDLNNFSISVLKVETGLKVVVYQQIRKLFLKSNCQGYRFCGQVKIPRHLEKQDRFKTCCVTRLSTFFSFVKAS